MFHVSLVQVAHLLRVLSFLALQLPIFTYLITQFQALGTEVRTFTQGQISATAAVLVSAGILLVCDLLGGLRAVAYTGEPGRPGVQPAGHRGAVSGEESAVQQWQLTGRQQARGVHSDNCVITITGRSSHNAAPQSP